MRPLENVHVDDFEQPAIDTPPSGFPGFSGQESLSGGGYREGISGGATGGRGQHTNEEMEAAVAQGEKSVLELVLDELKGLRQAVGSTEQQLGALTARMEAQSSLGERVGEMQKEITELKVQMAARGGASKANVRTAMLVLGPLVGALMVYLIQQMLSN